MILAYKGIKMEYLIGILMVLMAIIGGVFIGLTDWFDKLMKEIGDGFMNKIEGKV